MNSYNQDISIAEAREETRVYIEAWTERLRARLEKKKLTHA